VENNSSAKKSSNDNDDDDMFGGLIDDASNEVVDSLPEDESELMRQCEFELDQYLKDKGMQLQKKDPQNANKTIFLDPLKWWEENKYKYPIIAALAIIFLAIPASSAPSERIWSQAALVLTVKRNNLDEDVSGGIIFVKQNLKLLRKYYKVVTKDVENALPLEFSGLPDIDDVVGTVGKEVVEEIDVGQDMFEEYTY
jgi:hypothetical protein